MSSAKAGPHQVAHVKDLAKASADAHALHKALKSFFTDSSAVFEILCKRTVRQIFDIVEVYKKEYGKVLIDDIKANTSGHFEDLLVGLCMTPAEYDAFRIYKATKGMGTDEDQLIEILSHRLPVEVKAFNDAYQIVHGKSAFQAIQSDVSGELGHLFSLLANPANERKDPANEKTQLEADVHQLFKASQDKLVGHDTLPFINILGGHSRGYVLRLYAEYAKKHGKSLDGIIASWPFQGALERGLLSIATPPEELYADLLYKSMKGLGTNDSQLIRILVQQRERHLPKIAEFFLHKHKKSLKQWVKEDTGGDYGKALITLIEFYCE